MKKKLSYIPYPLCFKVFRVGNKREFVRQVYHTNNYYSDNRFTPAPFYKQIIKL